MKAVDSVPAFKSKLREYTNYIIRGVKKICVEIAPCRRQRAGAKGAGDYEKDLEQVADSVALEPFKLHPNAFMGWFKIVSALLVFGLAVFFLGLPILTLVLLVIAGVILICEFLFYLEFTDPLYKSATSHNLVAVRKAQGETKGVS